jgi:LysM repeat protein
MAMQRELDKLRAENQALKDQLAPRAAASQTLAVASVPSAASSPPPTTASMRMISNASLTPANSGPTASGRSSVPVRRTHRVQAGETLASIGRSYNVSLSQMLAANASIKPRYLAVGTVVNIPSP